MKVELVRDTWDSNGDRVRKGAVVDMTEKLGMKALQDRRVVVPSGDVSDDEPARKLTKAEQKAKAKAESDGKTSDET